MTFEACDSCGAEVDVMRFCVYCGTEICQDCTSWLFNKPYCRDCWDKSMQKKRQKPTRPLRKELLSWLGGDWQGEGDDLPQASVIHVALMLEEQYHELGFQTVVADPNGGIVLEKRNGQDAEVIHVWDDGTAEFMKFTANKLVERRELAQ